MADQRRATDAAVTVRAYGELVDLVGSAELQVGCRQPRSVKDLVESVGIPHCEVDLLLVDTVPASFDRLVVGGERVAVYPPFRNLDLDAGTGLWPRPVEPRRFALDVHLGTLARRLRMLGFDSWYRTDADDDELVDVAVTEGRILLSRDRQLLMRRAVIHGYCPRSDDPDTQLGEVFDRYRLAALQAPLTRCIPCNGVLTNVAKEAVAGAVPARTRLTFDTFARCGSCGQVYWPGAHKPAIDALLAGAPVAGLRGRRATSPRPPHRT